MPEQQSDHDLLIEVSTKLDRVISDVRDLKDNLVVRVEMLEKNKLDTTEWRRCYEELDKRIDANEKWRTALAATVTAYGGLLIFFAIKLFEHLTQ